MIDTPAEHREFLNRYYGLSRFFYDATRKYYLFGRDRAVQALTEDRGWQRLVEIGPGTGRNLRRLRRARPEAALGGIEASDAMLEHARKRCPWATLEHGFAETAPLSNLVGGRPDRILFSYCLSMVTDPSAGIAYARGALAPGGSVVVVDFADFGGFPTPLAHAFRAYLGAFHVEPLEAGTLREAAALEYGRARYYVTARFGPDTSALG